MDNQLLLPNGTTITFNKEQYEGIQKITSWLRGTNTFFTLAGYAGTGKQQPIDCYIQTPHGKVKIGDLKIGDEIFGISGKIIKINGVYPQGIKQSYKVTFRDNTYTEAGEEHLWNVWTHKLRSKKSPTITLTTNEILKSGLVYNYANGKKIHKYSIPLCEPVKYCEKSLPIDPYLLGVLIGDGTNLGVTPIITTPDIDYEIIELIEKIIPNYIEIHKYKEFGCPKYSLVDIESYGVNKLNVILKELKLNVKSTERFIPTIYAQSSIEQRYELLKGLMDTDGTSRGNRISYSTSSLELMNDIIELVQSLGGIAIRNKDDVRNGQTNYIINIKTFENPFKLKRKSNNWKFSFKNPPSRHIISIEKSRIVEQVCISVDSEDGLYLTDNFIVTHNTTIIKKILDSYTKDVAVSAPTHKAKKVISNTTGKDALTLHSLLGLRPDLDLDDFNPNNPQFLPIASPKIGDYDFIIIDEASMINVDLYAMIKKTVKGMKVKILFMGDPAQIPPIGEKESVVFFDEDIEIHWLTIIERQTNDNPLLGVYDTLRNNLLTPSGGFDRTTIINPNGDGVIFLDDKLDFRNAVFNKFNSTDYRGNMDFAKVIAWQNTTVMKTNRIIRDSLFGENSNVVEHNDVLMAYRSIQARKGYYNIVENSTDYRITECGKRKKNRYGIWGFKVNLAESYGYGIFSNREVFIIDSLDFDNLHTYAETHDTYKEYGLGVKKEWKRYYNFRRENMVMTTIKTYRDGTKRPKTEIIVKDLDYGYALTAHKSQGSTYQHVMIIENDMNLNPKTKERNQIKYVALTRPVTSATLLQ
jgi:hypothetical protein